MLQVLKIWLYDDEDSNKRSEMRRIFRMTKNAELVLSGAFYAPVVVNLSSDSRHSRVTSPSLPPASSRGPRPTDSAADTRWSVLPGRQPPARCRRRSAQPYRYVNPPSAFTDS